uniref:SMP-30/Gluconolactonase/LRE-like region domain-containing protein n=1 Tax=Percolomonas cosmopolitus TaxID=63605 RepID=A0A7S1KLE5_9EUKA
MQSLTHLSLNFEPQHITQDSKGTLFLLDEASGNILRVGSSSAKDDSSTEIVANTRGAPHSCTFDSNDQLFICDLAHQGILSLAQTELPQQSSNDSQDVAQEPTVEEFVREYESKLFRGPNSIVIDKSSDRETQDVFFTDSGLIGEGMESASGGSGSPSASGSLYWIRNGDLLQPIDLENLKTPYGVCLSSQTGCLYVAELQENRLIRYVRSRGKGGWIRSTWMQFSGRMGPSALAYSNGYIFVAHYDMRESRTRHGRVVVVDERDCAIVDEIIIENGCEVSGLCVSRDAQTLYITERVTKSVYKVDIGVLPQQDE